MPKRQTKKAKLEDNGSSLTLSDGASNSSALNIKVVILVGGPSKGTRFRPLSLDVPKPLFPVAGKPLIWHHLSACTKLGPSLSEVILIGFYDAETPGWKEFMASTAKELNVNIRYIQEQTRMGTAGGLYMHRAEILKDNPDYFFVLHCDICCTFPLLEILETHQKHGKEITILGKKVSVEDSQYYGCLAIDPNTNEILHYAEKPETFVSDIINCGIYLFSPQIFDLIDKVNQLAHSKKKSAMDEEDIDPNFFQLEQDVFMKFSGGKHIYLHETQDFWLQLKAAGMALKCSENLLALHRHNKTGLLAQPGDGVNAPIIVGDVMIHPSARIHPSAKIGPNVSIGENAVIGAGVRILHSIILDNVEVKDHACILHSIIGWKSTVGQWARLEGVPDFSVKSVNSHDVRGCGITILGTGVNAAPEIIVRASIVLPHKDLGGNYYNEILL